MASTELLQLGITEALTRIRSRQLSPVELTRAYLERISQLNPHLNVYLTVMAEEALAMGLVHRVLADDSLESFVDEALKTLSENAPLSIANSKTLIEEYVKSVGAPDHARMQAAMERCARSEDYKEGRRAFMEKRKPAFKGK